MPLNRSVLSHVVFFFQCAGLCTVHDTKIRPRKRRKHPGTEKWNVHVLSSSVEHPDSSLRPAGQKPPSFFLNSSVDSELLWPGWMATFMDAMSGYKYFTFTAEAAVFLINPFDVPDGLNILTVFAHSHDTIGLLECFRAGETTHKMQFVLHTNANTH